MFKELQDVDNEALQTQLAVWEESMAGDEEELEALGGIDLHNHEDAFKILMSKVGYWMGTVGVVITADMHNKGHLPFVSCSGRVLGYCCVCTCTCVEYIGRECSLN